MGAFAVFSDSDCIEFEDSAFVLSDAPLATTTVSFVVGSCASLDRKHGIQVQKPRGYVKVRIKYQNQKNAWAKCGR